eukprot:g1463.t1
MGNAPVGALEESQQKLLEINKKFYDSCMKRVDNDNIDQKTLKLLKKNKVNCLLQNPNKINEDKPSPGIHGLSKGALSGKKIDKNDPNFLYIPNPFWRDPSRDYITILHYLAKKGKYAHVKSIINPYHKLCMEHVQETVGEEIKKELRDEIHRKLILRKSDEFRDEIRVNLEQDILLQVEERVKNEKERLSKIMLPREVRSTIMKFKLNCQWQVEDEIIQKMLKDFHIFTEI